MAKIVAPGYRVPSYWEPSRGATVGGPSFNKWIRIMIGTKWSDTREKLLTNKQLRECLDNIESFDETYNRRCLNWFIKLAIMPAIQNQRIASPGKSLVLGAPLAIVLAVAAENHPPHLP